MKVVVVVGVAFAASVAVLIWSPKVAVVQVDVFGKGLDTRQFIPERRGNEGNKDGEKARDFVIPSQTIIRPGKAEVVIAHLGRVILDANPDARIPGETRGITIRIDWTRVIAEWALIIGCAAFAIGIMNHRDELSDERSALPSSSPNLPLQPAASANSGTESKVGQGGLGN